jgi:hypothetical protein
LPGYLNLIDRRSGRIAHHQPGLAASHGYCADHQTYRTGALLTVIQLTVHHREYDAVAAERKVQQPLWITGREAREQQGRRGRRREEYQPGAASSGKREAGT